MPFGRKGNPNPGSEAGIGAGAEARAGAGAEARAGAGAEARAGAGAGTLIALTESEEGPSKSRSGRRNRPWPVRVDLGPWFPP